MFLLWSSPPGDSPIITHQLYRLSCRLPGLRQVHGGGPDRTGVGRGGGLQPARTPPPGRGCTVPLSPPVSWEALAGLGFAKPSGDPRGVVWGGAGMCMYMHVCPQQVSALPPLPAPPVEGGGGPGARSPPGAAPPGFVCSQYSCVSVTGAALFTVISRAEG